MGNLGQQEDLTMKRREFLAASCLAAGALPLSATVAAAANGKKVDREYYELRKYQLLNRDSSIRNVLDDFLSDVGIPAMNRIGIGPVGVFNVRYGPNAPTVYVLMPHKSLESVATATSRLLDDAEYRKAGASFLDRPITDPAYVRMESSLMAAFDDIPKLELPRPAPDPGARILELRIYESHSQVKAKKKIEMFNEGGEIEIFRGTGLQPVFFGETLAGPMMPNLTYMVAFDNIEARYAQWDVFREDPRWIELKAKKEYKDTVSNITDIILSPTAYSQV